MHVLDISLYCDTGFLVVVWKQPTLSPAWDMPVLAELHPVWVIMRVSRAVLTTHNMLTLEPSWVRLGAFQSNTLGSKSQLGLQKLSLLSCQWGYRCWLYFLGLLWGVKMMTAQHLTECLGHSKYSLNTRHHSLAVGTALFVCFVLF